MNYFRFTPFITLIFLAFSATLSAVGKPPPNVLFLSVDDLKPLIGAYGDEMAKTPNMDRLANRGTIMLNNYCQQAVCAPSRMSMFTGLRPDSTKVWDLRTQIQDSAPDAVTMQQLFKENGYATAGAGKVMHGARNEHPESWSEPFTSKKKLPYAAGYPVPAHDNAFYQGDKEHAVYDEMNEKGVKHWKERMTWMADKGAMPSMEFLDVPDDAYADGALANWAIEHLEDYAKTKEPFFLTVGFMKPHLPFVAPKKYWDMYSDSDIELAEFREHAENTPDFVYHKYGELRSYSDISRDFNESLEDEKAKELIHAYYACVSYIDAQVGRVLDSLDELGLADNTIIVLWGDHGWHLGDHGMWCKHSNFEQATRSPLIISAPGYKPGRAEGMTEFVDIFPTLIELADLTEPYEMEGSSLVPMLKNPDASVKDFSISQYTRSQGRMGYAMRTDRYRYVVWMRGDWRSTMPYDASLVDFVELYDYEKDPLETVNQATNSEYQAVVEDLNGKMLEYFKTYEEEAKPSTEYTGTGVAPSANHEMINLAEVDINTMVLRFASVKHTGDTLTIDYENSPKWPSVDFMAPENTPWDLTGFKGIEISLTNEGKDDVRTTAYVTNPGDTNATKKRNGGRIILPAGATQDLRIDFDPSDYPLDLSRLASIRIFVDKLKQPATIRVNSIRGISDNASVKKVPTSAKAKATDSPSANAASDSTVELSSNGELLDLRALTSDDVQLRFAEVSSKGNALTLDFELSSKWPSVQFFAPDRGTWDLSDYQAVEVTLTNEGNSPVKTFAFVANDGDRHQTQKRRSAKQTIAPGETQILQIALSPAVASFDPSQVKELRVFVGMHKEPVKLTLSSMKAL